MKIYLLLLLILVSCKTKKPELFRKPVKNKKPLMLLFIPGLEDEFSMESLKNRIQIKSDSSPPSVFASLLTGNCNHGIIGLKLKNNGKNIRGVDFKIKRKSWIRLLSSQNSIFIGPSKKFIKNNRWKIKQFAPESRIKNRRGEYFLKDKGLIIFKKNGSNRAGYRFHLKYVDKNNERILILPENTQILEKGGNIRETGKIVLKKDSSYSIIFQNGAFKLFYFISVFDFTKDKVYYHSRGPVHTVLGGKPDFYGLKKEYISEKSFASSILHSFRGLLSIMKNDSHENSIVYIPQFSQLSSGLLNFNNKKIYKIFQTKMKNELKDFLKRWNDKNRGDMFVIAMAPIVENDNRVDLGNLIKNPHILLVEKESQVFLYPLKENMNFPKIKTQILNRLKPFEFNILNTKFKIYNNFMKISLPPSIVAGICKNGNFFCKTDSGVSWGYSSPANLTVLSNNNKIPLHFSNIHIFADLFESYIKFGSN
jgi:hypothetical protein